MRKPPTIPWLYRAAALLIAGMIGLYCLQFYLLGTKFARAVAALSHAAATPPAEQPAEPVVPGIVSVKILKDDKKR
jgi:hypothetical protein